MIGRPSLRDTRGFTLVEMLIVMAVIGLVTAIVVLNTGATTDHRRLRSEAERLRSVISLAQEEAVLSGREHGLLVQTDSYAFMRLDGDRWLEVAEDPALGRRRVPAPLLLTLSLEGSPIDLVQAAEAIDPQPQILILSSGEATPFELLLRAEDGEAAWRVRGAWDGQIVVEPVIADE